MVLSIVKKPLLINDFAYIPPPTPSLAEKVVWDFSKKKRRSSKNLFDIWIICKEPTQLEWANLLQLDKSEVES